MNLNYLLLPISDRGEKIEQKTLLASEMTGVAILEKDEGQHSKMLYLNENSLSSHSIIPLRYVDAYISVSVSNSDKL